MEALAPPLQAVLHLKLQIQNGSSMRVALQDYLLNYNDTFAFFVKRWLRCRDSGGEMHESTKSFLSFQLVQIIDKGLAGEPIEEELESIEKEMLEVCREDMDAHLEKLPTVMLIPLLALQFPGFMMVLLGPALTLFLQSMGGLS